MKPKKAAVIAGASSGLGAAFAKIIDETEPDIDTIYIIARRRERLEELAQSLSKKSIVLPADADDDAAISGISERIAEDNISVDIFVNCVGFAKIGNYSKISPTDQLRMIDTNCRAAVNLTLAVLPHMKSGSRLMEVCSTAAFQPLQHMNIYAASKSFLYSYTRGLRMELLPRQIRVTAVCPWWIRDTEFIPVASDNSQNPDVRSSVRHFLFAGSAHRVAKAALRANRICKVQS